MNSYESYKPTPFWFLNHQLEKEELLRQLQLMKESGVPGFFMHPRAGLKVPYGSCAWFEIIRYIVEKSEELGLKAWLYDEDPFPSGAAGGRICMENPAFRALNLCCKRVKPDAAGNVNAHFGDVGILSVVAILQNEAGDILQTRDLTAQVGVLREEYYCRENKSSYYCDWVNDVTYSHVRAETYFPEMVLQYRFNEPGWEVLAIYTEVAITDEKHMYKPDCLNGACTQRFIELTHEKYKETLGEYFGTVIPGIFIDEPSQGGFLPWTGCMEEEFFRAHGYHLKENLYRLWVGKDESSRSLRADYWSTVGNLYEKNFFEPLEDWCKKNGLLFVGHLKSEENPLAQIFVGKPLTSYLKHLDMPGFDIICHNLGNHERPALLFGALLAASDGHQQGKNHVLCEAFACNPFNFGMDGVMRITNWLFALGITWLVPHGFYYSYDGYRKYDAGKSFFFQDDEFVKYPEFCEYTGKYGFFLGENKNDCNTALFYPYRELLKYYPAEQEEAICLRDSIFGAVSQLVSSHVVFDIVTEDTLDDATIENGILQCGQMQYKNVLIPKGISFSHPYIAHLQSKGIDVVRIDDVSILSACRTHLTGTGTDELIVNRKKIDEDIYLFVFNNASTYSRFSIHEKGYLYYYDVLKDVYFKVEGEILLNGYEAGVYVVSKQEKQYQGQYENPDVIECRQYEYDLHPQWEYVPKGALQTFSRWNISITSNAINLNFQNHPFCEVRSLVGTENKAIMERRKRPWEDIAKEVASHYPVRAEFSTTFFENKGNGKCRKYLLIEGDTFCGDVQLFLNDKQLKQEHFHPYFVYDFSNMTIEISSYLEDGENVLRVVWKEANERDGIYTSIHIMQEENRM